MQDPGRANNMDVVKILSNVRSLSSALKDCPAYLIDDMIIRLQQLLVVRRQERDRELKAMQQIDDLIVQMVGIMKANSIPLEKVVQQLMSHGIVVRKPHREATPKYRFTTLDGQVRTWSGQGKTPRELLAVMARDNKGREEYLISTENKSED